MNITVEDVSKYYNLLIKHGQQYVRTSTDGTYREVSLDFVEYILAASSEQYGTGLSVRALLEEREVPTVESCEEKRGQVR